MDGIKNIFKNKGVVSFIILAGIFTCGFLIKYFLLTEKEETSILKEKVGEVKEIEVEGESGVTHRKNIAVNIEISDRIKEKIKFDKLKKELEVFCDDEKIEAENLTAKSDGSLYENFDTGEIVFHLQMNNFSKTVITVTYQNDIYRFSYR